MIQPDIEIIPATPLHVRLLSERMRAEEIESSKHLGTTPHKALWRAFRMSLEKKTAFINGEIAAMWGVAGTYLGEVGYPWLSLAPTADSYPFRVAFIYRQELKKMLNLFPVLEEWVDVRNTKSIRLLEIMGFEFEPPSPRGANGELFMRAEKRA